MPLVAAATLAYATGLLCGFGAASSWSIAVVGLVVWHGARHARERIALVAMAIAGLAIATSTRKSSERCVAALARAREWRLTLEGDATPGAFVPARHACGAAVRISVEEGRASVGAPVLVTGEAVQGKAGLVISRAAVRAIGAPGVLPRWRSILGEAIDNYFGADAPLVRALLIADMQQLSPAVRSRFAAAGLSHMLSVSGLHVGLIAVAGALIAQMLGLPRGRADLAVVLLCVFYVAVIGAPLPAVRSAIMLALASLSKAIQRPTSPWAILAVGALLPLVDPRAVTDVGYQLSVVGMAALIAAGALGKRWSWLGDGGWRGEAKRGLTASVLATLVTAPLVAATFGRLSVVGPLSNIVAVPIIAVLQPMLFLAALLFPAPIFARFVADACHPLIAAIDGIAGVAASLPGAAIVVAPDPTSIALAGAASAAIIVAAVSRHWARPLATGMMSIGVLAWRPMLPLGASLTELHMIDVGQGDAIALRSSRGRWVVFDAGRDWKGGDEGQRDVVPYIAARGGTVEAFVLSHPHSDHVGGATSVLRALRPSAYFDPGYAGGTTPYRASLEEARRLGTHWKRVHPGDSLVVDDATITFLAPDSTWASTQNDPNLASTVARIRVGTVTMLLTGDAEEPEERWLLDHSRSLLGADVLKVGHHGSRTSSSAAFLDAVRPRVALISVGAGNMYRHPSPEIVQSLAAHGAIALRTDHLGSIVIRTDGTSIEVESGGERWPLPTRH